MINSNENSMQVSKSRRGDWFPYVYPQGFEGASLWLRYLVKKPPAAWETQVWSLVPWKREWQPTAMFFLAWRIPWAEGPGGPRSMGSHKVRCNLAHSTRLWNGQEGAAFCSSGGSCSSLSSSLPQISVYKSPLNWPARPMGALCPWHPPLLPTDR